MTREQGDLLLFYGIFITLFFKLVDERASFHHFSLPSSSGGTVGRPMFPAMLL